MLTPMRLRTLALVLMLPVGMTASPPPQPEHAFVPLVGLWRAGAEAGRPTFTVDGTAPSPKPDEEGAKAAFGPAAPQFVKAMSVPGVFPLATVRDVSTFTTGRLSVEFKILAGATDQTAGVVFNLKPDGTYTYARYNTKDGNVAIWKFENGARTVLAHGELHEQLPFATWHRLSVQVKGRQIVATVNDKLRVSHTLDRDVSGRVGLWTKADSVTAFRAFTAGQ
jgi:hypothetical protein